LKKIFITICIVFSLTLLIAPIDAIDMYSENYVLYNLDTKTVVLENNKDANTSIASLTKIMTAIVAIESIEDINSEVTITYDMLKGLQAEGASVVGYYTGNKVTYEELLYGTLLNSGADATRALAISLYGSEASFVNKMNEKAKEIGLETTVFTNSSGLDTKGQTSTVDEIARLLMYCLDNETFKEIFGASTYTSASGRTYRDTFSYGAKKIELNLDYVKGAKTGYTDDAGRCLASIAYDEINGINYLLVTTKAPINSTANYHIRDAKAMYDYAFTNYKNHVIFNELDILVEVEARYSELGVLPYAATVTQTYFHDNTFDSANIKYVYDGLDVVTYKNKVDEKIGTLEVYYEEELLTTIDITIQQEVDFSFIEFVKYHVEYFFGGIILLLIMLICIVLLLKRRIRKRAISGLA